MNVEIELPGQRDDMTFVVGDRRLQQILLRRRPTSSSSSSSLVLLLFKVQSTSSRRFRVRPTLGVLSSAIDELTTIQIQLSPGEREPCDCKFLIVVRQCAREEVSSEDLSSKDATRIKELWKQAESRDYESLVVSKTITARIVATADQEQEQETPLEDDAPRKDMQQQSKSVDPEATPVQLTLPQPTVALSTTCAVPKQLPVETIEQRAQVVLMMMKNRSQRPRNHLNLEELSQLQALKDHDPAQWMVLDDMARRLRQLLRAHRRRARA